MTPLSRCPYIGLRPFGRADADLFFGREDQVDELLERLNSHRFVAVVGASGCGKSSLVSAGLVPDLEEGFLDAAADRTWFVAETHPGDRPLENLTDALLASRALGERWAGRAAARDLLAAELRASPLGLTKTLATAGLAERGNLLIVVDQFEEIFRYYNLRDAGEATSFVNLLLASVQEAEIPVYIVLTMRSDFLGDCALFQGLPEAMNDSQFLTPRLTRHQWRAAIQGPAQQMGATVDPLLLNRLLNDMGANPDQLPLMQHALMRVWHEATRRADGSADSLTLDADQYKTVGGLREALSLHADEVYHGLDEEGRRIAQVVMRCLSEREAQRRDTRRPLPLEAIARVADVSEDELIRVVDVFRQPDCSFLVPPPPRPLATDTILDIGHESLIRQWQTMKKWVKAEHESAVMFGRLLETARLRQQKKAGLWGPPDLDLARSWWDEEQPTEDWAERYGGDFYLCKWFLEESVAKQDAIQKKRQMIVRRKRRVQVGIMIFLVLAVVSSLILQQLAHRDKVQAIHEHERALEAEALARSETLVAQAALVMNGKARDLQKAALLALQAQRLGAAKDKTAPLLQDALSLLPTRSRDLEAEERSFRSGIVSDDGKQCATVNRYWNGKGTFDDHLVLRDPSTFSIRHDIPHAGALLSVKFPHGNGDRVATVSEDGHARVFDSATGALLHDIHFGDPIRAVAISSDGRRLAVGGAATGIRVLLLGDEEVEPERHSHGRDVAINDLDFHPDGTSLASAGADGSARVWTAGQATEIKAQIYQSEVMRVSFSPGGTWLAAIPRDRFVELWSLNHRKRLRLQHYDEVNLVSFSRDGRYVATGSKDNTVRIWETETGAAAQVLHHEATALSVLFSEDAGLIVTTSADATARIWDRRSGHELVRAIHEQPVVFASLVSGDLLLTVGDGGILGAWDLTFTREVSLLGHTERVSGAIFSGDGARVVTTSIDGTIHVWDANSGAPVSYLDLGETRPNVLVIDHRGRHVLVAGRDGPAQVWDLETRERIASWNHSSEVLAADINADGTLIALGTRSGDVEIHGLSEPRTHQHLSGGGESLNAVSFHPDGRRVAAAGEDGSIRIWDLDTGRAEPRLLSHDGGPVMDLAWSRDGLLASAGTDLSVKLWGSSGDIPKISLEHDRGVYTVAFDKYGERLVTAGVDGDARIYELTTHHVLHKLHHAGMVKHATFSHAGNFVLTSSDDHTARVWDPETGEELARLEHERPVAEARFSPADPGVVVTISHENVARLWRWRDLDDDDVCDRIKRNLTEAELKAFGLDPRPNRKICPDLNASQIGRFLNRLDPLGLGLPGLRL